jgi:hypothetical protein
MKAEERKTQEQQTQWAEHVQKENKLFAEAVPEFADKAKAKELTDKAVETLLDVGFTDQELGELATGKSKLSIYDHRVQQLILGNVKWNDAQKARTAVTAKPVPPVRQRRKHSKPSQQSLKAPAVSRTQRLCAWRKSKRSSAGHHKEIIQWLSRPIP